MYKHIHKPKKSILEASLGGERFYLFNNRVKGSKRIEIKDNFGVIRIYYAVPINK